MRPRLTLNGLLLGALLGMVLVAVCHPGVVTGAPIRSLFWFILMAAVVMVMAVLWLSRHLTGLALSFLLTVGVGYLLGRTDLPGLKLAFGMVLAGLLLAPLGAFMSGMLPDEYRDNPEQREDPPF